MQNKADYWIEMCDDDLWAARNLLASKDYFWMGFVCHLIVEKSLKAIYAGKTEKIPRKTHDLPKLAEDALINDLNDEQLDFLEELMPLY
ncbi:MAG: HEPN domain-containing protein [Defluviitaleaceae bacterium]|nr:HEPN domain-containing protein [Defluviitaleaceae bacterium]